VIEFVLSVVESERVRVLLAPSVNIPVPVVMVLPFMVVAFNAPFTSSRAVGAVVPIPTLPALLINRYGAVLGAVPPIPTFPADWRSRFPLVAVPSVKLALVVVKVEADNPVTDNAPLVLVKFNAPLERVNPFEAVKSPANVPVPLPVAEILPLVVIASPLLLGDNVVPVLLQYPSVPLVGGVEVRLLDPSVYTPLLADNDGKLTVLVTLAVPVTSKP